MEDLKFYLTMLQLLMDEHETKEKPRKWTPPKERRGGQVDQARPIPPMRTLHHLRGSQRARTTQRHPTRHN